MSTETTTARAGRVLRSHATHHAMSDWEYTRTTGIKHIRMVGDSTGRNTFGKRLRRAIASAFDTSELASFFQPKSRWHRISFRWACAMEELHLDSNRPDGALNHGSVITHWEEDGEYIQLVQPSVGEMLADFLDAEPDNPHAVKIAGEISRILDGYRARIKRDSEVGNA